MCDIPVRIKEEIIQYARQYKVEKVYLFGSRANGTNQVKSDIDVAFLGGENTTDFIESLKDNLWTLLKVDVVDLLEAGSDLREEILTKGVVIYEKI